MNVEVQLFARARDLVGRERILIELTEGGTVAMLRRSLEDSHAGLRGFLSRCAIAVEQEYVSDDAILAAGSHVAVIPPVSGG